jgi:hypothetical protein
MLPTMDIMGSNYGVKMVAKFSTFLLKSPRFLDVEDINFWTERS